MGAADRPHAQQSLTQLPPIALYASGILPGPSVVIADICLHGRSAFGQQPQLEPLQVFLLGHVQPQLAGFGIPCRIRLIALRVAVKRRDAMLRQSVQHAACSGKLFYPESVLTVP